MSGWGPIEDDDAVVGDVPPTGVGDVEESEEEQIVTVPDVDQDGVHDLDMIDSLVDEGIGDVEEQWARNARCNNEEYRGSKMGQARDRGKTGASADVADDLHRDEAAGLPGNNILDCQESQVAQWLALECFPSVCECSRAFTRGLDRQFWQGGCNPRAMSCWCYGGLMQV